MFYKKSLLCIGGWSLALILSSCAYQMQIQQGVALTTEQISALKPGMTQAQVTFLLGTPNLIDSYHPSSWYYIYTNKENREPLQSSRLVVNFTPQGLVESFTQTSDDHASS
ncbi:MAG: outer membrane protein assembly factor BamE [Gammaproteobacteria bacterium]|jgi:outer membrane protein assembly factor BamE|nr:outer membrane protein assembly factor BamE [Gammaproteobacteria bacterium]